MSKTIEGLLAAGCILVTTQASSFGDFNFVGYWEAVDPTDGATINQSITRNDDGSFSFVRRESTSQACGGQNAWAVASGMQTSPTTLDVYNAVLTCADGSQPIQGATATFTGDILKDTMTEFFPMAPPGPATIHHRLSSRFTL